MKFVRFGNAGQEKPGLIDASGRVRDLSAHISDIDSTTLGTPAWTALRNVDVDALPDVGSAQDIRFGPCVAGMNKIVCVGLNEKTHAKQMGVGIHPEPAVFFKPLSSLNGPSDPIVYPKIGQRLDWEAELAIIVGETCKYVDPAEARSKMAGFCIINDVSDRYWQIERGLSQALAGKWFDTFAPLGPWLVTPDEMQEPDSLSIRTWVNDKLMQDFSSADYIFNVDRVLAHCSQFFTLYPGDVIAMGSGPGNGGHWGQFLQPGDTIRISLTGLGEQKNLIVMEA